MRLKHYLLYTSLLLIGAGVTSCSFFYSAKYSGPSNYNFNGTEFLNHGDELDHISIYEVVKWQLTRKPGKWKKWSQDPPGERPPAKVSSDSLRVTFINHSTSLLQFDNINLLTDPVYSSIVGPGNLAGDVRTRPPGIRFNELPEIDVVVISHIHYDHFDIATLKRLEKKDQPLFIVPLGAKEILDKLNFENVVELDWWEDIYINNKKITFTPAKHFSNRTLDDYNKVLWGSYVIESSGGYIYYAGDTGWGDHFLDIQRVFKEFRFSMIPIGPISPDWIMNRIHINPKEAVKAHLLLNSRYSMGIHFGTFLDSDDSQGDPVLHLCNAINEMRVDPKEWYIPAHGKGIFIPPVTPAQIAEKEHDKINYNKNLYNLPDNNAD